MIRKEYLSLIVFCVGCSPIWTTPHFAGVENKQEVCLSLPTSELDEASRAVKVWSQATAGWKQFEIFSSSSCQDAEWSIVETNQPLTFDPKGLAYTKIGHHHIRMVKGRYEGITFEVVLHEFGHALGAQHVERTLMDPNYNKLMMDCPDQMTVLQVAAWQHLPIELFAYCIH